MLQDSKAAVESIIVRKRRGSRRSGGALASIVWSETSAVAQNFASLANRDEDAVCDIKFLREYLHLLTSRLRDREKKTCLHKSRNLDDTQP